MGIVTRPTSRRLPPSLRMVALWPDADKADAFLALHGGMVAGGGMELFPWQRQVLDEARRFNVVCVGRRAGKTSLGTYLVTAPDVRGKPVGWFSPTFFYMTQVWRDVTQILDPLIKRQNAQEHRLELTTGGVLEFWSLDNPRAGRSRKYARVLVDEAAFAPGLLDAWNFGIRATLADLRGDAWLMSTPKGRNGFWQLWQRGPDAGEPDWMSWQMPSEVNPLLSREELAEMRRTLPELVVQQEMDAMFIEDAGGVFRRVMEAATLAPLEGPQPGRTYIAGVDVADAQDWTVVSILDATSREQVYVDRFNRVGYEALEDRLHAAYQRFNVQAMVIEDNSVGQPVIDHLVRRNMVIIPFHTSAATKGPLIQSLQSAFEHGELRILNDPTQVGELQAYEAERTASGFKYSAPPGLHDDMVMALAFSWYGIAGFMPALL